MPGRIVWKGWLRVFMCVLIWTIASEYTYSQKKKHSVSRKDSLEQDINARMADSILQIQAIKDTTIPSLVNKVRSYSFILNRSGSFYRRKPDTSGIMTGLKGMERGLNFFKSRMERAENQLNLRNLNTAVTLLQESAERLSDWQKTLSDYSDRTSKANANVQKILHDSSLQNQSADSALHGQLSNLLEKAHTTDSTQRESLFKVNTLRNRVSVNYLLANDLISEINYRTQTLRSELWKKEEPPLLEARASDYSQSLLQLVADAIQRADRITRIFMLTTWDTRSMNILIWLVVLTWLIISTRRINKFEDADKAWKPAPLLHRSVIVSSLVLLFTFGPFLYSNAPMAYMHINDLFRLLGTAFLLTPFLRREARITGIVLFGLWIYYAVDDLLLDSAFGERWCLLISALLLSIICLRIFSKKRPLFLKLEESPGRKWIVMITLLQAVLSIIFNFAGRVTLAKIFGVSAIQGLLLAVCLKVFFSILVEGIYLQSEAYRQTRFSAFLNFGRLKKKLIGFFWVLAIIAWIIALFRTLGLYELLYNFFDFFFNKTRSIGSIKFSYRSLALFLLILWLSSVISQFISFFFDDKQISSTNKKRKAGSIVLLLRIAIWTTGFLIAIGAAGIPLNKIQIMLGALGVGIGFGLQNLVNNLASGIIIAFEQPIQVGDFIEIGPRSGTVKEIGVRSSKVNNGEGGDIIIPNGDLISQQFINWTRHTRNRRLKIIISVPYNADIKKTSELIQSVLKNNEKVMQTPPPAISIASFSATTVDFEVLFWTFDLDDVVNTRGQVMIEIFDAFAKNNIPIHP